MNDRREYFKKYYENNKDTMKKSSTFLKFRKIENALKINNEKAENFRKQLAASKSPETL